MMESACLVSCYSLVASLVSYSFLLFYLIILYFFNISSGAVNFNYLTTYFLSIRSCNLVLKYPNLESPVDYSTSTPICIDAILPYTIVWVHWYPTFWCDQSRALLHQLSSRVRVVYTHSFCKLFRTYLLWVTDNLQTDNVLVNTLMPRNPLHSN